MANGPKVREKGQKVTTVTVRSTQGESQRIQKLFSYFSFLKKRLQLFMRSPPEEEKRAVICSFQEKV